MRKCGNHHHEETNARRFDNQDEAKCICDRGKYVYGHYLTCFIILSAKELCERWELRAAFYDT